MTLKKEGWRNRITGHGEVSPESLLANPLNWRTHPKQQRDALEAAIDRVGFVQGVIVNTTTGHVVDGHLRVDLAMQRDEPLIAVDYVALSPEDEAIVLATLDPLSALAGRDQSVLDDLLAMTGDIEDGPLANLLASVGDTKVGVDGSDTEAGEPAEEPYVKLGEVWTVGEHRIMCGDSTNGADVARLMNKEIAHLVHADPPYGMGKEKDGVIGDNQYGADLDAFQMRWWQAFRPHVADNGSAYIWGNAEDLWRLWYAGGLAGSERLTFRNEITWWKGGSGFGVSADARRMYEPAERCLFFMLGEQGFNTNADNYWDGWEPIRAALMADCEAMGWTAEDVHRICGTANTGAGMYSHWFTKSQWTLIPEEHYLKLQAAAREHDAFKREHDELKQAFYATRAYFDNTHDNMTDVWHFPRVEGEDRHGHATPKPVAMIERAILSSTPDGSTVAEPFLGSGTTAIAAANRGRKCYGMEISPAYAQVSIERLAAHIGEEPKRL